MGLSLNEWPGMNCQTTNPIDHRDESFNNPRWMLPPLPYFLRGIERIHRHMTASPEIIAKVANWRQKARDGTISLEEMKEAIQFLRADREAMPAAAKKGTAKAPVNANDLLKELGL
jgi:hypothetical protein